MQHRPLIAALVTAVALGSFGGAARADDQNDMSFSGNFKMDRIDRNKDGMVSKAEFMAMMEKVWEMKMKEMKIKGDKISAEDLKQILMYMRAGS